MRQAGESIYGDRPCGMIVVLWRAGLRIHEALAPAETDLEERRSATLVATGAREAHEVDRAWEQVRP